MGVVGRGVVEDAWTVRREPVWGVRAVNGNCC